MRVRWKVKQTRILPGLGVPNKPPADCCVLPNAPLAPPNIPAPDAPGVLGLSAGLPNPPNPLSPEGAGAAGVVDAGAVDEPKVFEAPNEKVLDGGGAAGVVEPALPKGDGLAGVCACAPKLNPCGCCCCPPC